MLKFIHDYLKTKIMCRYTVKNLPSIIRYVHVQNKTQKMCDKAVVEDRGTLESLGLFLTAMKMNKCVIKLLTITLMH